ncbi:MAG: hypothetical protein FJX74_16140 [Armatimonadetes bacterium]|nr:hypothetical protein [Armatimonadota bacterium]
MLLAVAGGTALYLRKGSLAEAATTGNATKVRWLLALGADPNLRGPDGATPLGQSLAHGHLGVARLLVKRGADPNAAGPTGEALLCEAVRSGRVEAVEVLLEGGARPDTKEADGSPLVVSAAGAGRTGVVQALLEHGADPNVSGPDGTSPLMKAAIIGAADTVQTLLAHGARVDARTREGYTALHLAVRGLLMGGLMHEQIALVDPHDEFWKRQREGCRKAARVLLEHGADPFCRGPQGTTPLREATVIGDREMVALLRAHGAKRVASSEGNRTAAAAADAIEALR